MHKCRLNKNNLTDSNKVVLEEGSLNRFRNQPFQVKIISPYLKDSHLYLFLKDRILQKSNRTNRLISLQRNNRTSLNKSKNNPLILIQINLIQVILRLIQTRNFLKWLLFLE